MYISEEYLEEIVILLESKKRKKRDKLLFKQREERNELIKAHTAAVLDLKKTTDEDRHEREVLQGKIEKENQKNKDDRAAERAAEVARFKTGFGKVKKWVGGAVKKTVITGAVLSGAAIIALVSRDIYKKGKTVCVLKYRMDAEKRNACMREVTQRTISELERNKSRCRKEGCEENIDMKIHALRRTLR